ncbi:hypothetical protein [Citreicoccus inhibens]|uniref:hypothetical protein n=1 Tax=Citreicoccus inhibens TaxID=2849499 RepID=UPI001C22A01C|nr:hypothetical protein [Citreicoccus inhibens]
MERTVRLLATVAVLLLAACSRSMEGPQPTLRGVTNPLQRAETPARVCNAQGGPQGWPLELIGTRFMPVPRDALTDTPTVELPEVTLRGPLVVTLDDTRIHLDSPELLRVDIPTRDSSPAQELPPGLYAVDVTNPLGGAASLDGALRVVLPPTVTRVTAPQGFTRAAGGPLVIEGTDFQPGAPPTVVLRRPGAPDVPLAVSGAPSATLLDAQVPPGAPEGVHDLVVTRAEGCSVTLARAVDVAYARVGPLDSSALPPESGAAP